MGLATASSVSLHRSAARQMMLLDRRRCRDESILAKHAPMSNSIPSYFLRRCRVFAFGDGATITTVRQTKSYRRLRRPSASPPPLVDGRCVFSRLKLCFWDLESGERRVKQRRDLRFLFGGGDHFCLVTGPNEQER